MFQTYSEPVLTEGPWFETQLYRQGLTAEALTVQVARIINKFTPQRDPRSNEYVYISELGNDGKRYCSASFLFFEV